MRPSQVAQSYANISIDLRHTCLVQTRNVGLRIPRSLHSGSGKPHRKDHETTSPRIYVNRRTPSCSIFEFSRFECTRQKRVASFTIKSTADARKARAVRKAAPLRNNIPAAKVRRNSELFSIYGKNVLFCSYIYTSMPFSINIWHSRVILI